MNASAAQPAITDADLARLLGLASAAPPPPADLAARLLARVRASPPAALPPIALPQSPLPAASLRPARGRPARRWLRIALGSAGSLLMATAVAAGLAQTPMFAAYLQPLLAPLASVIGAKPAPPATAARKRTAPPTVLPLPRSEAPSAPLAQLAPPATPTDLAASLPPIVPGAVPPPALVAPALRSAATPQSSPARRALAGMAAANPGAVPAPRPEFGKAARATTARTAIDRISQRQPLSDAARPQPVPVPPALPELAAANPPTPAAPAIGIAVNSPSTAADPTAAIVADGPAGQPPTARTERAAQITDAIAELRAARKAGTLTPAQAQRLRGLQQLRAARAARPPRSPERQ